MLSRGRFIVKRSVKSGILCEVLHVLECNEMSFCGTELDEGSIQEDDKTMTALSDPCST